MSSTPSLPREIEHRPTARGVDPHEDLYLLRKPLCSHVPLTAVVCDVELTVIRQTQTVRTGSYGVNTPCYGNIPLMPTGG